GLPGQQGGGRRRRERGGGRQQGDRGAPAQRGRGDVVAHLARRAVGDVAHGIDRLARGTGGDNDRVAREVLRRREHGGEGGDDRFRLRQPTTTGEPGGQRAAVGLHHGHAARAQRGDVRGHRRMLPHAAVHRRRDQHRAARGQQQGGQEVVGDAVGGLGDEIGGGGRHHDGRRALGQRH